jgi:DUF3040 family protein
MALSMEEQRILAEIEQHLARAEPALAARLAAFGHPGAGTPLRSSRARIVASFVVLMVIAAVSFIMYALPLHVLPDRGGTGRPTSAPRQPAMTSRHQSSATASQAASQAAVSQAPSPAIPQHPSTATPAR